MVFRCYTYLKAICTEAVEHDFLAKDPGRKLKRPKTRKPDETVLNWAQYQSVIDGAEIVRDKLAIKVGSGTAVRPGELFAFRWSSLEKLPSGRHALKVTETVYKSKIRPWAKTEGSEAYVPLPKRLALELEDWRRVSAWPGGVISYSRTVKVASENFEARLLDPIREKLGLVKLNFQILRRSYGNAGSRRAYRHFERRAKATSTLAPGHDTRKLCEGNSRVGLCYGR
jgi:integrase